MPAGAVTPARHRGETPILMALTVVGGLRALRGTVLPLPASAQDLVGNGGIGFRGGIAKFNKDEDVAANASARLSAELVFSYVYSSHLMFDVTAGYAWN